MGALENTTEERKWRGCVVAADGRIHRTPWNSESVLSIDPKDGLAFTFERVREGDSKWAGAVVAFNGRVYCVPYDDPSVLMIDASVLMIDLRDNSVSYIGNFRFGKRCWCGGVLAGDGKIYCVPYNAVEVLCIDPLDDSVSTFGMVGGIRWKWRGGALGSDV